MRIIVCVKQICHTYARTGMAPEMHYLAPEDSIYRVNPYDEVALGLALRIKRLLGGGEIIILTLGPLTAETELRRCLAVGADHLYQIDRENGMDPWCKSWLLARAINDMEADLVLCGKESLDNQNGQVGAFMAHHLDMPFVSAIRDLTILPENHCAKVQRSAGRGVREIIECPLPAVFSVDLGGNDLFFPSYVDKEEAKSQPIKKLQYPEEIIASQTVATRVFPPRPRPKKIPVPDNRLAAYHRIEQLLRGSHVEKRGTMLKGSPESQAKGMIDFLQEQGFLQSKVGERKE